MIVVVTLVVVVMMVAGVLDLLADRVHVEALDLADEVDEHIFWEGAGL